MKKFQNSFIHLKRFPIFIFFILNSLLALVCNECPSQSIVYVKPNYLVYGQKLNITITGINTAFSKMPKGKDTVNFYFYDPLRIGTPPVYVNSYKVINDTAISANISVVGEWTGYKDLVFTDYSNKKIPLNYGRRYAVYLDAGQNVTLIPNTGYAGQTLNVSIIGTNTDFVYTDCYSTSVWWDYEFRSKNITNWGSARVIGLHATDATHAYIGVYIPDFAMTGYQDFYIQWACDMSYSPMCIKENALHVINNLNNPGIKHMEPDFTDKNQILNVTVLGSKTDFNGITQATSSTELFTSYMNFGRDKDINVNMIHVLNDTTMAVNLTVLPYAKNGLRDFRIISGNGSIFYIKDNAFAIGPNLLSINPALANVNETRTIDINCENVNFTNSNIRYFTVWLFTIYSGKIEEIFASSLKVKSSTQLSATFSIPSDAYQGSWFVNIADNVDGYFYRPDILEIGLTLIKTDNNLNQIFKVYPNPFSKNVTIDYLLNSSTNVSMSVYNLTGLKIADINYGYKSSGLNRIVLNANKLGLSEGIYCIRLNAGNKTYYSKIVYQK